MNVKTETVTVRGQKGALAAIEYERSNPSKAVISTRPAGNGFLEMTVVSRSEGHSAVRLVFRWANGKQDVRFVSAKEAAEETAKWSDPERRAREGLLELDAETVRRDA